MLDALRSQPIPVGINFNCNDIKFFASGVLDRTTPCDSSKNTEYMLNVGFGESDLPYYKLQSSRGN